MAYAASLLIVVGPVLLIPIMFVLIFANITGVVLIPLYAVVFSAGLSSIILFTVAMRRLAMHYREPSIFNNALYAVLANVVGTAVAVFIEILILSFVTHNFTSSTSVSNATFLGVMISFFMIFAVIFVFSVVGSVFYNRAFSSLAEKSGINSFKEAGTLILIGTALTIVFVGGVVVWVGWIFAAMSFSKLTATSAPAYPAVAPYGPSTSTLPKRYCPYCGTPNDFDSKFCKNCGKPQ